MEAGSDAVREEEPVAYCADDLWCDPGFHDAWWVTPEEARNDYGDGYHSVFDPCMEGTCDEKHPACIPGGGGGGSLALADLRRGVADENFELVRTAMTALGPDAAMLIPERSALQVIGCDDRVIVHLPVSSHLIRRLGE